MVPALRTLRSRWALVGCVALLCLATGGAGDEPAKPDDRPAPVDPGAVEVRFSDNSLIKLKLKDEKIDVKTAWGKLQIPIADIHRIEFATRVGDDVQRQIDAAIANLGSTEFKVRETATNELLKLGARAYGPLLEATKNKDPEIVRRAEEVLEKIRETTPADVLIIRKNDVIHTADSKITGRIEASLFKATTFQFGDVQIKLQDVRSVRSLSVAPEEGPVTAEADPGTLLNFRGQVGKTYVFRVTGNGGAGSVWGSGVYTADSALASAAVHAGVLREGQTGNVKVMIVQALPAYTGSTQNGVTSFPYGPYEGAYRIVK